MKRLCMENISIKTKLENFIQIQYAYHCGHIFNRCCSQEVLKNFEFTCFVYGYSCKNSPVSVTNGCCFQFNKHTHTNQNMCHHITNTIEQNRISSTTLSNILSNGNSVNHEFPKCFELLISFMSSPVLRRLIFKKKSEK